MNIQGDLIVNVKLILKYGFVFILIYVKQNISLLVHLSLEIEKNLPNFFNLEKKLFGIHIEQFKKNIGEVYRFDR